MALPLPNLTAIAQAELDALEARFRDELGLELEAAALVAVIRAPDGDPMDRYSLGFHATGEALDGLIPDVRVALADSCTQVADDVAP